jgi:hypothetical protein
VGVTTLVYRYINDKMAIVAARRAILIALINTKSPIFMVGSKLEQAKENINILSKAQVQ